jgi:hypothetical protein
MKKPTVATRKPRTHFEQVPLHEVKKVVESLEHKTPSDQRKNLIREPVERKTEPYSVRRTPPVASWEETHADKLL